MVIHGHSLDRILLRHEGWIQVELPFFVDRQQKLIEFMLGELKPVDDRGIIDADIEHSSF